MEKYIKPVEIIDWFSKNKDNQELLSSYGYELASKYINQDREFLGYYLSNILELLKDVLIYRQNIDPDYNPEFKITSIAEGYSGYNDYCINGQTYKVKESFMSMFIYEKESFKEKIKDLRAEVFTDDGLLSYTGEGSNLPIDLRSKTITDLEVSADEDSSKLEDLKKSLEDQIKQKEEEFAIQISRMKLEMAKTMEEAHSKMLQSKTKIANMESYFYRYMCYKGYTFELKKLCGGNSGEGSLVIWQKLRYLDEELPRLCTLEQSKSIDFNSFTSLEKLIATNEFVRDFFLPSQRCVVAFQLSRKSLRVLAHFRTASEATGSGRDTKVKVWLECVETAYLIANWNKLGLFIRNGENIYVAWLDKDKINIIGESLFVTNSTDDSEIKADFREIKDVEEYSDKSKGSVALENLKIKEENNNKSIEMYNKYMSRVYVVDILQGILDNNSDILNLPKGQSVLTALTNRSYKDIIFNNSDGYIEDLKWKNFEEVYDDFKLKEEDIKYGYSVYVLTNSGGKDRGRINSYVDRTNDTKLTRGITKINMIDFEDTYLFYKDIDKSVFKEYYSNDKGITYYNISSGLMENYDTPSRVHLNITYEDGSHSNIQSHTIYVLTDGKITDCYNSWRDVKSRVGGYNISDFDKVVSMKFVFTLTHTSEYRRVEEPLVPRYAVRKEYWSKREKQVNEVYSEIMNNYKKEICDYEFVEDKSCRSRKYYFYVSCAKSWSDTNSNVLIEKDEFITLKNVKQEHIDYMINHKFVLPGFYNFAESLDAYLEIKNYIAERDNKNVK